MKKVAENVGRGRKNEQRLYDSDYSIFIVSRFVLCKMIKPQAEPYYADMASFSL
jgi:hypothetical protein